MKSRYIKPWTILIVLSAILSAVFTACNDEEEPKIPGCAFPFPSVSVESENGLVVQIEDRAYILSDSKLWENVPGFESLKSVIEPSPATFENGPIDLSNSIGKRLKFNGHLAMIHQKVDTMTIDGKRQAVVFCELHKAELKFLGESRSGESIDQAICGTTYSSKNYADLLSQSRSLQNIAETTPLIKLYVTVLRWTNGTSGLNKDLVSKTILNNLNWTYASTGIHFLLEGTRYLDIIDNNLYTIVR